MELKTVLIDGLPCQMSDKDAAIVQRTITQLSDQIENFKKKFAKKEEEEEEKEKEDSAKDAELSKRDEAIKTKDALIATLQQQLKDASEPAAMDAALAVRDAVRFKARKLMGDSFKVDGKKIEDIRKEVVVAKSGVPAAKDWGDAEIAAVFEHLTAGTPASNPIKDAARVFSGTHSGGQDQRQAAYLEMVADMENGWKNPAKN